MVVVVKEREGTLVRCGTDIVGWLVGWRNDTKGVSIDDTIRRRNEVLMEPVRNKRRFSGFGRVVARNGLTHHHYDHKW